MYILVIEEITESRYWMQTWHSPVVLAAVHGDGQFNYLNVAVNNTGNEYVADSKGYCIQVFTTEGKNGDECMLCKW